MLREIADKLWAIGLKDMATALHEKARQREVLAKDALDAVYTSLVERASKPQPVPKRHHKYGPAPEPIPAQSFKRLCYGCTPAAPGPGFKWQPMTRGECQSCGRYASLMAFREW